MKKIGILTFHCAHNYGAVLQCYALQETLKKMGHDVEVIDYRPEYLLTPYNIFNKCRIQSKNPILVIKHSIREMLLLAVRIKRHHAFDKFITNRLNLSYHVAGHNIPDCYDVYIMGSDQIWNPKITKGFDPVYFGKFNFQKKGKKYISYAASMEAKTLSEQVKNSYKKLLKNFDFISVRETQLAALLQPLTDLNVSVVLDPTLLADISIWNDIAKDPNIKDKYVLVYQVRTNDSTLYIADNIAKQINAKVIEITAWHDIKFRNNKLQYESPESFLGLIKNASCIITTSFHGTAFSIIFNRPFFCIQLDDEEDTRSISLLKSLKIENRLISKDDNPVFVNIDYKEINKRMSQLKKSSLEILTSALNIEYK